MILASALRAACAPARRGLARALESPREAQSRVLREILNAQSHTELGRWLGISPSMSEDQFKSRVPIVDFDQGYLASWSERQRQRPKAPILCPGGARALERTSGSSGPRKIIPYSAAGLRSFNTYMQAWAADILQSGPRLSRFRMFASVSPAFLSEEDKSQRIGLEDETEYLRFPLSWIARRTLSAPMELKTIQDPFEFRHALCTFLVADAGLEIISVWHPSFFTLLWEHLLENRARIAAQLDSGKIRVGSRDWRLPASSRRSALLRSFGRLDPLELWPGIKLVSAWDLGNSQIAARKLKDLFPGVFFQGKGLLATEAPVTLPMIGLGQVPFLSEVHFELLGESGVSRGLAEAEVGCTYELVLSQRSGLLRYRLGDRVLVSGKLPSGTPLLDFQGRANEVADLVGEKVSAAYLRAREPLAAGVFGNIELCFVPEGGERPRYLLLADAPPDELHKLAEYWESALQQAFHYGYARKLGQLGPLSARHVPRLGGRMVEYYRRRRGMRSGDIKPPLLITSPAEGHRLVEYLEVQA